MRDRIGEALETADLATASCSGVIEDSQLQPVVATVAALRSRLSYPDDVLVVALAGGTGSGKSSLFNAMAGAELADVGGVRPTTGAPEAAVPESAGVALEGHLDALGVPTRHVYEGTGLCLIDLPDTDSVEVSHRHRVDALLPLVDVVVWVTDPEKYRDARLHDDYLRPLAGYSSQFVCVINRCDRLDEVQLAEVMADFSAALAEDGLDEVPVVSTSASPPAGPPVGVDVLLGVLDGKRRRPETLYMKLVTDLERSTGDLAARMRPVEFDDRAAVALDEATSALVDNRMEDAIGVLTGFLDRIAEETGGLTGAAVTRFAALVPGHVSRIADEARLRPHRRRLFGGDALPGPEPIRAAFTESVARPARTLLAKRAVAVASLAELAIAVENLRLHVPR